MASCGSSETINPPDNSEGMDPEEESHEALIDLSHWKVTLPIGDPTEVEPPEILDYPNIEILEKFMFDDPEENALVFHTKPGSTTANSSYSRTELREQLEPGSNKVNWTFKQGGHLKGRLRVSEVSGQEGALDRIIVMQIHGRLTDEQRDLIGEDDNNAPPVLKIYWDDGKINVRRKILKDLEVSDIDILKKDAWTDESHWSEKEVGFDPFDLEIKVSENLMEVKVSGDTFRFDDVHVNKWSIFYNYFKAGNYLQTADTASYATVKYYELEVSH